MTSPIATRSPDDHVHLATVPLERDGFLRTLIRHLSGTLQDIVGLEEPKPVELAELLAVVASVAGRIGLGPGR